MEIIFNSRKVTISEQSSLHDLIIRREVDAMWSLVFVNSRIIGHGNWKEKILNKGNRIEVLSVNHLGEGI